MYKQQSSTHPDMYLLSEDSLDGITDGENEQEASRFILRVISSLQSAVLLRWSVRLAESTRDIKHSVQLTF